MSIPAAGQYADGLAGPERCSRNFRKEPLRARESSTSMARRPRGVGSPGAWQAMGTPPARNGLRTAAPPAPPLGASANGR